MATRKRKRTTATWWTIAAIVVMVGFLVWWLSARRAEAPGLPASQPGARALSAEPGAPEHAHEHISGGDKADLSRIIRERGAKTPGD